MRAAVAPLCAVTAVHQTKLSGRQMPNFKKRCLSESEASLVSEVSESMDSDKYKRNRGGRYEGNFEFKIESCKYRPTRDVNKLRQFERNDIV
jgi:hypothetical protein